MGGALAHMAEMRNRYRILVGNLKGRDHCNYICAIMNWLSYGFMATEEGCVLSFIIMSLRANGAVMLCPSVCFLLENKLWTG